MNWINGFVVLVIVVLSLTWTTCQWIECRDNDLSAFYCLQHIQGGGPSG